MAISAAWSLVLAGSALANGPPAQRVRFNRDIRPILSENCFSCHGPDETHRKAKLRLDVREGATAERDGVRAIVPGDLTTSELYRRITADDPDERMPPAQAGKKLTARQIDILTQWIGQGAEYEPHWSWVAPRRAEIPAARGGWARNPIDRFVLEKLEQQELRPTGEAQKATLIRRLTLDLTGLPPTLAEVNAFLADSSPSAYERLVDRLLASPRYGEHMARYWLDAARYADTHGYQQDQMRTMWRWRDWVIDAYNRNMPFDQFTAEQIAGDLLPQPTEAQLIATGFNRNHLITIETGVIDEEYRIEYVMDRVSTTATVWLGLTMNCARCHNHKYDAVTQRDYYRFFAFFNNVAEKGLSGFDPQIRTPTAEQSQGLSELDRQIAATAPENESRLKELKDARQKLEAEAPLTMVMRELDPPRKTFILARGQYDQPGEEVKAGVPESLPPLTAGRRSGPANRLDLARWIVSRENPLTARVIINRLWYQVFGVGLVRTGEDFGTQGEWPSHPELVDWLAVEFIESGWDIKHVLRLMVSSATYRQSSRVTPELFERDPENRLLARGPRFRLDAEAVRDSALAAGGLLAERVGGPPAYPYQPPGLWLDLNNRKEFIRPYPENQGEGLFRRSVYTFWKRTVPPPTMVALDAPDREYCVVRRSPTNTPLQALAMLNDPQFVWPAIGLAQRMMNSASDTSTRLRYGFRTVTGREPSSDEVSLLLGLLRDQSEEFRSEPSAAERLLDVAIRTVERSHDPVELAAWVTVARLILNLDEAMTKE